MATEPALVSGIGLKVTCHYKKLCEPKCLLPSGPGTALTRLLWLVGPLVTTKSHPSAIQLQHTAPEEWSPVSRG